MPTLSRYFIRSALVYLAIGFTFGSLILSAKAGAVDARVWVWLPMHITLLLNGWLVQLSMGVAYWILPRIHVGERGRQRWAWSAFIILQIGLGLALLSAISLWEPEMGKLLAPAVLLQALGVALFAVHAWPRIRPTFIRAAIKTDLS
ncbi:MAG: hypothetical protein IT324_14155 [Anaerolineae bacterium]|nr:hypothetical protein [Anaerolineae bacterium]